MRRLQWAAIIGLIVTIAGSSLLALRAAGSPEGRSGDLIAVASPSRQSSSTPSPSGGLVSPVASSLPSPSTSATPAATPRPTATRPAPTPPPPPRTGPQLAGCPMFPTNNIWNRDVSSLPVNARSAQWLANMGTSNLHPDFGAAPYGYPFAIVDNTHPRTALTFTYASESDPGPYPFGPDIPIEQGSDRHAFMLNRATCTLYELFNASWNNGHPTAGSGAIFNLRSNALRPNGWTSADAAGLPMLPALVRLDEVRSGAINHALRFTAVRTDRSYLWPARHQAGAASNPALPPMGARFRLKSSFSISRYSPQAQVVLRAMEHYGMVLADNGSNWFFQGTQDAWPDSLLSELKTIPSSAFEAVDESSLMIDPNSGAAR